MENIGRDGYYLLGFSVACIAGTDSSIWLLISALN